MEARSALCRICGEIQRTKSDGARRDICEPCAVRFADARARILKLEDKAVGNLRGPDPTDVA